MVIRMAQFLIGVLLSIGFFLESASAQYNSLSLAQLQKRSDLFVEFRVVKFWGNKVQVQTSDVCVDGDNIRAKNPWYDYCEPLPNDDNSTCLKPKRIYLSMPRTQTEQLCEMRNPEGDCIKERVQNYVIKLNEDVTVYQKNSEDPRALKLFTRPYRIPQCLN